MSDIDRPANYNAAERGALSRGLFIGVTRATTAQRKRLHRRLGKASVLAVGLTLAGSAVRRIR